MTVEPQPPLPASLVPRPALAVEQGSEVPADVQAEAAHRYGLAMPDLSEARQAITNVYGTQAEELWTRLLQRCGLRGQETDRASMLKLLQAMRAQDPVMALCARALSIRMDTYDHLTAAYHIVRSPE